MTRAAGNGGTTAWQRVVLGWAQQTANLQAPYIWGGFKQLGSDCSAFVSQAFRAAGYSVGGFNGTSHGPTSEQQATFGVAVPLRGANKLAAAVPGEVLFFDEPGEGSDSHEAIYAGGGKDYEESAPGQPAHLIPVDTAHLEAIRQFVNPATGRTKGAGITGAFNHHTPAAVASIGPAGTGATATATDAGGGEQLFNRSMLVRVGVGVMAVLLLLIGLDQIAKPGNPPSRVITEGATNTANTVSGWSSTASSAAGPPIRRAYHSVPDSDDRRAAAAERNAPDPAEQRRRLNAHMAHQGPPPGRSRTPSSGSTADLADEDF